VCSSDLDEIDSGLDIDALRLVSEGINKLINEDHLSLLLITHYQRILDYIKPQFVHIMVDGRVVKSGGYELAQQLDKMGYEWVKEE
jgi:Fe-S cluster assembly ATP-binding protein